MRVKLYTYTPVDIQTHKRRGRRCPRPSHPDICVREGKCPHARLHVVRIQRPGNGAYTLQISQRLDVPLADVRVEGRRLAERLRAAPQAVDGGVKCARASVPMCVNPNTCAPARTGPRTCARTAGKRRIHLVELTTTGHSTC